MKKTMRIFGSIILALVVAFSMTISSFAVYMPEQTNNTYPFTITGSGSATSTFTVTSGGSVRISGEVYYIIQPNTEHRSITSYVYIYGPGSSEPLLSLWLNSGYMGNSTSGVLSSLTYQNSRTISLPVGTYTIKVETSGANTSYASYFSVDVS